MKKKIICIICARGGSKELKNKNLKKVLNRPLIYYPIKIAQNSNVIDDIIVSTDSKKIAKAAKSFGAQVPFMRPSDLSGDYATTEDTLRHALINFEKIKKIRYDICVFLTATDIFRKTSWVRKCVNMLIKNPKFDSVFSGYITHKNFWEYKNGKWKRLRSWMSKYSSRQIRRTIAREDTGIACATRANFWRKGKRIGNKVLIIPNHEPFTGLDIHNKNDLKLVEYAIKLWKF